MTHSTFKTIYQRDCDRLLDRENCFGIYHYTTHLRMLQPLKINA